MPEFSDAVPDVVPRPEASPHDDWWRRLGAFADHPLSGFVLLGGAALLAGGWWYTAALHRTSSASAVIASASRRRAPASRATTSTAASVLVHVSGAVARPGLYQLAASARVADAVDAAGGATPDADLGRINLAAHVSDGEHVVVPRVGDAAAPDGSGDAATSGPVSINTASETELEGLPRIGPALAQAIIDYRTRHGPFRTISDLGNVRGIGDRLLDELRPLISL